VHLINEQHARHDFGFAFLTPLGDLGVDLGAQFGLDFASVASEEREETLCTAIDNVDFVQ